MLCAQVAAENYAGAISSYTAGLSEAVAALHGGSLHISRQVGRIRLGNLPGLAAPTVSIHQHLAAALLCARSACWRRLGNAWRALCDAEAAVETFPEWGTPHARLGEALESVGDAAAALRSYRRAVAFSPGVADFGARLDALLLRVLGLGGGGGGHLPAPGLLANPEARWVAAGGGPPRLWLELRSVCCCMSLDLGTALWRMQGQQGGGLDPLLAQDQGAFVADQQQLLEAALGVVVSATDQLCASLEGVLDAGLEESGRQHWQKGHTALALGCLLAWCHDAATATHFFTRALDAFSDACNAPGVDHWRALTLRNRALCHLRTGDNHSALQDATAGRNLAPQCAAAHARCGDVSATAGDWAAAAAHYTAALKLCEPGTAAAMDAASRLAVASNGGRGATGPLGGQPTPQGSPVPSPCGSPLLHGGRGSSGAGGDGMPRTKSDSSLMEALTLGGKDEPGAAQSQDGGAEAVVQAAVNTYMRTRKRRGKQPQGSSDDGEEAPASANGKSGTAATGTHAASTRSSGGSPMGGARDRRSSSPDEGAPSPIAGGAKSPAKRSRPGTPVEGLPPLPPLNGGNSGLIDPVGGHQGFGGSGLSFGGNSGRGGSSNGPNLISADLFGDVTGDDAFDAVVGGGGRDAMTRFLLGEDLLDVGPDRGWGK